MANVKADSKINEQLSDADKLFLQTIYYQRCLNKHLASKYIYENNEICENRVAYMLQVKLLEPVDYGKDKPALFLTTFGVETVKMLFQIPAEEWDPEASQMKRIAKTAFELKMKPQNIAHQMALNSFVLEFKKRANGNIAYKYFDAKYMPPCSGDMMPDGLIELGNRLILLEMDMGNERSSHLSYKWNNYRSFLNSPEFYYQEKQITMLFILDNVKVVSQRKNTVLASINRFLIDRINGQFEIYADAPEALLDILTNKIIYCGQKDSEDESAIKRSLLTMHGFSFSQASFQEVIRLDYGAYIRRLSPQRRIVVQNGRPQEFLFDTWLDGNLSTLHKIIYHNRTSLAFKSWTKRPICYLVAVPSEKWINATLSLCSARGIKDVYFTTLSRLKTRDFGGALFQIDETGAVYHFTDSSLRERVFERRYKG